MKPQYKISTACLIVSEGSLLLIKEEQHGRVSWDIPAGGIEIGETLEEGIVREVLEETGVQIEEASLKVVYQLIEQDKTTVNFLYEYIMPTGSNTDVKALDSDIKAIRWFSKEEIRGLIEIEAYEHQLAKERLLSFLSDKKDQLTVVTITAK